MMISNKFEETPADIYGAHYLAYVTANKKNGTAGHILHGNVTERTHFVVFVRNLCVTNKEKCN